MHFIPATARNCCLISLAQLPVGKVMEFFNRLVIMESVTERQHLPVVVSDTPMLSPTSLWYARCQKPKAASLLGQVEDIQDHDGCPFEDK